MIEIIFHKEGAFFVPDLYWKKGDFKYYETTARKNPIDENLKDTDSLKKHV